MKLKYFVVLTSHFIANYYILKLFNYLFYGILIGYYLSFMNVVAYIFLFYVTFAITKKRFLKDKVDPEGKAVFVTGCDTGFGHELVKKLDAKGFHVFAGCLFPDGPGAQKLEKWCSQNLKVLPLDVTKDDSVHQALESVQEALKGSKVELWVLVNNAGIFNGFSVDLTTLGTYREVMEVNAFGMIRVTKTFLPLLKKSRGRIVNVTSVAGRMSTAHLTPYGLSKCMAVAFSDSLRQELCDWGISVVSIEPELFQTNLTDHANTSQRFQETLASLDETTRSEYGKAYFNGFQKDAAIFVQHASPKINVVVRDLELAVTLKYPAMHYRPRRSTLFRFLIYCFVASPCAIQDIVVEMFKFLYKFPKPAGVNK